VETFTTGGQTYHGHYETTILQLHLKTERATVDLSSGQITFFNGLRTKFKDGVVRDAYEGTIVWDTVEPSCQETVSEVYMGEAELHARKHEDDALDLSESIIMVADNVTGQFAGLVLKNHRAVCGVTCFATQVKGIVACLMRAHDTPLPKRTFRPHFDSSVADAQTQLSYLHLKTNLRMYSRFEAVQADICRLERRLLSGRLQALAGADNPYALLDLYGPGHTAYVSGAAAYVTKCPLVEAIRVDFANCTKEVPVLSGRNHTLRFADPYTWILKTYPTIVPCSDVMPVRWKVRDQWYCATPQARPCPPAAKLNTTTGSFRPDDFTQGVNLGIYTEGQKAEHREYLRAASSREAVVAKVVNAASRGARGGSGELGLPLGREDLKRITDEVGRNLIFSTCPPSPRRTTPWWVCSSSSSSPRPSSAASSECGRCTPSVGADGGWWRPCGGRCSPSSASPATSSGPRSTQPGTMCRSRLGRTSRYTTRSTRPGRHRTTRRTGPPVGTTEIGRAHV
jgi:hypothetical protein